MKYFLLCFIFFFLLKTSQAQITEAPNNRVMIDNIQTVKPQSLKGHFPHAKISHITGQGTVYSLPLDNMPCLVPDIKSNMPVQKINIHPLRKIPNALPEYKIIPGTDLPAITKIPKTEK